MSELIQTISIMALPVIFAVALHETAHGYVASLKGDDTAKRMGRLTLNPLAHIDWFGTVALPVMFYITTGFLFAYAKPVPVNFHNLQNPRRDMVWVAAAGPFTNLVLAVVSALLIKAVAFVDPEAMNSALAFLQRQSIELSSSLMVPVVLMLYFSVILNIVLAIINLIPVPPADGGRIMAGLLPVEQARSYAKLEPYGLFILIFILLINPFNILGWTIQPLITGIIELLI